VKASLVKMIDGLPDSHRDGVFPPVLLGRGAAR